MCSLNMPEAVASFSNELTQFSFVLVIDQHNFIELVQHAPTAKIGAAVHYVKVVLLLFTFSGK